MTITTAVDDVTADLMRLQFLFVNLYLFGTSSSWVLIDAGLKGSASKIVETAEERFGPDNPPQAVVLTHAHFDHIGAFTQNLRDLGCSRFRSSAGDALHYRPGGLSAARSDRR